MSDYISSVSKSCFLAIRDLRRIRNTLDYTTAQTIATSLIHSKVGYCNSLFLNLPRAQLDLFNSFLTLPLALFLTLLNSPIFHPFSNHYIGLKSINAFTTKSRNHLQNAPISQILLSPQSSPCPVQHFYAFLGYRYS